MHFNCYRADKLSAQKRHNQLSALRFFFVFFLVFFCFFCFFCGRGGGGVNTLD